MRIFVFVSQYNILQKDNELYKKNALIARAFIDALCFIDLSTRASDNATLGTANEVDDIIALGALGQLGFNAVEGIGCVDIGVVDAAVYLLNLRNCLI